MVYVRSSAGVLDIIVLLQVQPCDICPYCKEHFQALIHFRILNTILKCNA